MKLVNPTLDQLDAFFAEKVAGWTSTLIHMPKYPGAVWWHDKDGNLMEDPDFTSSMDSVLPYLESHRVAPVIEFHPANKASSRRGWHVMLEHGCNGWHDLLATAAVIALLRANGHEVEFTNPQTS